MSQETKEGAGAAEERLRAEAVDFEEEDEDEDEDADGGAGGGDASKAKKKKRKNRKKKKKKKTLGEVGAGQIVQTGSSRALHAVRALQPGALVLAEQAYAWVPHTLGNRCSACGKLLTRGAQALQDAECPRLLYCSRACLDAHEDIRSLERVVLSEIDAVANRSGLDEMLLRLVVRILTSPRDAGVVDATDKPVAANFARVLDCYFHRQVFSAADLVKLERAFEAIVPLLELDEPCTPQDAVDLACRVNLNAHALQGVDGTFGVGLFPLTALINHGCRPNCTMVASGSCMEVRTVRAVAEGEELTLPYIDIYASRTRRRSLLADKRRFDCECIRCREGAAAPEDRFVDALLCPRDKAVMAGADLRCEKCGAVATDEMRTAVADLHMLGDKALDLKNEARYKEAVAVCKEITSRAEGFLHAKHEINFGMHSVAMNCARWAKDPTGALPHCRAVLDCLKDVMPPYDLEKASHYDCLGDLLGEVLDGPRSLAAPIQRRYKQEQRAAYQSASANLAVCYGTDHERTRAARAKEV